MARDAAVPDDEKRTVNDGSDGSTGASERFGRRSYLKLAGSVAAAAGLSATASAQSDDYDVITASGQVIRIGDETWENKLIDCRNGGSITVVVEGAATIRNVGLKGLYRGNSFIFTITNSGGTVTFDNVYLGDGANKDGEDFVHGPGGVFYHRLANCRVEFTRMNVQGFPNNGFYCSNTADGGSVHWTNCYGKNNGVSTFRCAGSDDSLENCVAYNDDTDYATSNGSWGGYGESHGRPLWVWSPGTANVDDCHFAAGSYSDAVLTYDGGAVTLNGGAISGGTRGDVRRNGVGSDPDLSIPDGVPTSAEEAAMGSASVSSESTVDPWTAEYGVEHIYEVENTSDQPVDYYLQVSEGAFEPLEYDGAVVDREMTWADGDKAAGRVAPGDTHCWGMNAWLVDVTIEDAANAAARVNGTQSSLGWYPRDGADGDEWKDLDALLEADDEPEYETFVYEVEAREDGVEYFLEAKDGADFTPQVDSERVYVSADGTRAAGLLEAGETHGFTGYNVDAPAMLDATIRGDGSGYVNGSESSLDWYPQPGASGDGWKDLDKLLGDQEEHTLLIDGVGSLRKTSYEFRVGGAVEPTTHGGASINDDTVIDDGHVSGSLRGWRDAFDFSGDLESLRIDGTARVTLDGERIDPNEYGAELNHMLTIVSTGSPASYEVSVDGRIETMAWDDSSEYATVGSGRTATGSIDGGYQRFRYSGSITDLTFTEGSAMVYADRDRISPGDF
ncbi:hypothetical protein [Haloterrigena alkaliphila]|uniref:Uncharacterized protein n=1 Tax=Haloterrigena alkaliphila TaxID=2816475 RepID=A0A8A2VAQ8_9EURY|nr:hypothetical protein [Haloterrigena alkaliphila]QSW99139.1 hypothetical protein J0X25_17435 [Haloterrigena alkaliphila]